MAELIGGSGYDDVQDTSPTSPSIGDTWLDTSTDPPVGKVYADLGGGGQWTTDLLDEAISNLAKPSDTGTNFSSLTANITKVPNGSSVTVNGSGIVFGISSYRPNNGPVIFSLYIDGSEITPDSLYVDKNNSAAVSHTVMASFESSFKAKTADFGDDGVVFYGVY